MATKKPLESFDGELKTVKQVAEEKGYHPQTVRKMAYEGKLNYVRQGRRVMIAIDEQYQALKPSEKGILRQQVEDLKRKNAQLMAENDELGKKDSEMRKYIDELRAQAECTKCGGIGGNNTCARCRDAGTFKKMDVDEDYSEETQDNTSAEKQAKCRDCDLEMHLEEDIKRGQCTVCKSIDASIDAQELFEDGTGLCSSCSRMVDAMEMVGGACIDCLGSAAVGSKVLVEKA